MASRKDNVIRKELLYKVDDNSEQIMAKIRKEAEEYGPDLTYNINESGYY
jgi:hypothetical protein